MRIVVTGSRDWPLDQESQIWDVLSPYAVNSNNEFAQGGAPGVDSIVDAFLMGETFWYPADWNKHGKAAGPIRNREMLDHFKPDIVLAFFIPGEANRGTWDCVEAADARGVRVRSFRLKAKKK